MFAPVVKSVPAFHTMDRFAATEQMFDQALKLPPGASRDRFVMERCEGDMELGSYLVVDLGLVARKPFIVGLGFAGLLTALGAFAYVRRRSVAKRQ